MSDKFDALIQAIKNQAGDVRVAKVKPESDSRIYGDGISLAKNGLAWCCFQNNATGEIHVLDLSTLIYSLDMAADGIEFTASKILRDFNYECVSVTERMRPNKDA
jgi:hypothetical protein